jgi:phosphoglucomutase
MGYKETYQSWLNDPYFDDATKEELRAIAGDEKEIEERFYRNLAFGTAGLRGIIGAGTNRMNIYTVRKATQGLANYIRKVGGEGKGVAIAYDSRHKNTEFADCAALCLAANGIKAYVFESLRPTPELSFAVCHLNCIAGINITASHNPSDYNGYKVYWEDGAQITPPHDTGIMDEVAKVGSWSEVKTMEKDEAVIEDLYQVIGADVDVPYLEALKSQVLHPEAIKAMAKDLKIVYTPLHGTGNIPARKIMRQLGFEKVYPVDEQRLPDGDFPTVPYPNPEAEEAFALGLALAKKVDADLVLATDPDADRLGVRVKDKDGVYHDLTGNMSGCLLADYEIGQRKAVKGLPDDGVLISTIVSSNMAGAIARDYGVGFKEVLTGFKYIGQQILQMEESGKGTYLFGFEESYGCLIGTHARDKDAIVAVMALCEAAAYYKQQGMTLWDAMIALYERVGYYRDSVKAIGLAGKEGLEKIASIMDTLRSNPPEKIGSFRVTARRDYEKDERVELASGKTEKTGLPSSNVLYFELEDDAWVCVRPSGTEPKIKFYYGVRGTSLSDSEEKAKAMDAALGSLIDEMV